MRSAVRALLLGLAFAIPWEYSLDLGAPYGNIARIAGVAVLLIAALAVLRFGPSRSPSPLCWISLALFLWLCCSSLWAIDTSESLRHLRTWFQEVTILWIVWEFVDTPLQLRRLMQAYVAGAAVLASLTLGAFLFSSTSEQVRFFAAGQDPNDAARMMVFALPFAAFLVNADTRWPLRATFAISLPLITLAVLLTGSRSGFVEALVGLGGSSWLLLRTRRRGVLAALFGLPALAGAIWLTVPTGTILRVASVADELQRGHLNQRWEIWLAGWQAFVRAPWFGSGIGSFVLVSRLAPPDTAHNTALALAVEGGIIALFLAAMSVLAAAICVVRTPSPLRIALASVFAVGTLSSIAATVQENRATWLLLGLIAAAARLSTQQESLTPLPFAAAPETLNPCAAPFAGAGE